MTAEAALHGIYPVVKLHNALLDVEVAQLCQRRNQLLVHGHLLLVDTKLAQQMVACQRNDRSVCTVAYNTALGSSVKKAVEQIVNQRLSVADFLVYLFYC